jgi:opacity protein-like surface antigen
LRWEIEAPSGVFFALGMGAAVHNGELTAVDADRKALGSRVLFHPSAELGYRFDGVNSVSLFADHMSNGFTQQYNDGLDTIGIRFGHLLNPVPSRPAPEVAVADYSGAYLGGFAGYHFEAADWYTSPTRSAGLNAFDGGAVAGYSWQSGRGVFGLEIDASPASRSYNVACDAIGTTCHLGINGIYSVRPRFGWIFGNTMFYGTGGVALAPWQARVFDAATGERFAQVTGLNYGVAVGGGIEQKLSANLSLKAEVMHYGIPGWDLTLPVAGPTFNQLQSTVGRAGVSWYFH